MSEKTKKKAKSAAAAILALFAGVANCLFGGGGGMLIVPALGGCMELPEKKAHASAVAVMFPLSLCSVALYVFRGTWDIVLSVRVGIGATMGAVFGAFLLKRMPKKILSVLFYGIMIYAGIKYLQ